MTRAADFKPRPMKLSVLTAALQELTPRERRDADPDLAVEEWLALRAALGPLPAERVRGATAAPASKTARAAKAGSRPGPRR